MIGGHPGGVLLTKRLLELAGVNPPAKILDLGAGSGASVRLLRTLGYEAEGIDRIGKQVCGGIACGVQPPEVAAGDMTGLPFSDESYDLCLAECSVSVCGDGKAALREACRVLRPGGSLLLSDIFFRKDNAPRLSMSGPLTMSCWEREIALAGFAIRAFADETALWREFFLESLWNDDVDETCCDFFREAGKAGCGYFLAWLEKRCAFGSSAVSRK